MQAKYTRQPFLAAVLSAFAVAFLSNPVAARGGITPVELEPITMIPSTLTVVASGGSETTCTQNELEMLGPTG